MSFEQPLPQLPWNTDVSAIPYDKPVLVRNRTSKLPHMAQRNSEYEPDMVEFIQVDHGYGWYAPLTDIEAFLEVL